MRHILLLATLSGAHWLPAQLVVTNTQTPAQLVQNVLLGNGIVANNIMFNGLPANAVTEQVGEFNSTNANVGIASGLILATGNVMNALGPNNSGSSSLGGGNLGQGDPDLLALAQSTGTNVTSINDAAVLEFDFTVTGDSLKFNFVFASDEYLEFVNSINDAFGFFLSGPGISGPFSNNAANIALIPGTTMPVTINSVNATSNSSYYVDNGNGTTAPYNSDPYYVQYDGLTVVMTAAAQVICGETYHIKLVVGDANDTVWDSAVFLEAGSFQSNEVTLASEIVTGGVDSLFYEGCGSATLYLVRGAPLTDPDSVRLVTAGTATAGVDYTVVPPMLYFAPGQDTIAFTLDAFFDGVTEGQESIVLFAIHEGNCGIDTAEVEILIEEPPPIDVVLSNGVTVICGDSALITATVTGGFGSYYLDWDQGVPDGTYSGWVAPLQTTTYSLTVTDDCGVVSSTESVTINVPIPPPLVVQALPDIVVHCPETGVTLQAQVQGGDPGYTYLWSNGLGTADTAHVAPAATQSYSVTVTDVCGRDTSDVVTVTVAYDTVEVRIAPDTTICINDTIVLWALASRGWGGVPVPLGPGQHRGQPARLAAAQHDLCGNGDRRLWHIGHGPGWCGCERADGRVRLGWHYMGEQFPDRIPGPKFRCHQLVLGFWLAGFDQHRAIPTSDLSGARSVRCDAGHRGHPRLQGHDLSHDHGQAGVRNVHPEQLHTQRGRDQRPFPTIGHRSARIPDAHLRSLGRAPVRKRGSERDLGWRIRWFHGPIGGVCLPVPGEGLGG